MRTFSFTIRRKTSSPDVTHGGFGYKVNNTYGNFILQEAGTSALYKISGGNVVLVGKIVTESDLGGAVFSTATGAIKYGMNGIYLGKFSNGPVTNSGSLFEACIYLIGTRSGKTTIYVFSITDYASGHLFFNRLDANNSFELTSWKKLI